jgi:hypothetical protein
VEPAFSVRSGKCWLRAQRGCGLGPGHACPPVPPHLCGSSNCEFAERGDAHLQNFGIVMFWAQPASAPVYDLVTTTAHLPKEGMALTLNGSTQWLS